MEYPVMLSILVPTYNHERYIKKCLNSIFEQTINCTYEILVGEDCSTDATRKELEDIINEGHTNLTVFFRKENMHATCYTNSNDLRDRARGKYLIYLEGDDYWTDEHKIQMQIDFLESHKEYIAVAHNCIMVDEQSNIIARQYPECKDRDYSFKHYNSGIMPGQQATVLMRNFRYIDGLDSSFLNSKHQPGDRKLFFTLLCYGKIYCFQKVMSAYRYVDTHGSSWTATHKFNYNEWREWYIAELNYAKMINNREAISSADFLLLLFMRQGLLYNKSINFLEFIRELGDVDNLIRSGCMLARRDFNKYILKRRVFF